MAEVSLPSGERSVLTIDGPCGFATREIDVPARGTVEPVQFALPSPDAAALELIVEGSTPPDHISYQVEVWSDDYERQVELRGAPRLVRGLPPGRYRVGIRGPPDRYRVGVRGPRRRWKAVTLEAGSTTRVELTVSCVRIQSAIMY